MYMVTRAILVKLLQNEQLEILTLAVFEVQKGNVPFWKWQKNRVQMVQTIFESNEGCLRHTDLKISTP